MWLHRKCAETVAIKMYSMLCNGYIEHRKRRTQIKTKQRTTNFSLMYSKDLCSWSTLAIFSSNIFSILCIYQQQQQQPKEHKWEEIRERVKKKGERAQQQNILIRFEILSLFLGLFALLVFSVSCKCDYSIIFFLWHCLNSSMHTKLRNP